MRLHKKTRRAFTIGELMVGIAVLGILATGAVVLYMHTTTAAQEKRIVDDCDALNKAVANYISTGGVFAVGGVGAQGSLTSDGLIAVDATDGETAKNSILNALSEGVYACSVQHTLQSSQMDASKITCQVPTSTATQTVPGYGLRTVFLTPPVFVKKL